MPAIERYTGVVYQHLDIAGLSKEAKDRALSSIAIVDGLFGLVGAGESIPDYKLKVNTRLGDLGRLTDFWRDFVITALTTAETEEIWSLLPTEHQKIAQLKATGLPTTTVEFIGANGLKTGHNAKAAKGEFVKAILKGAASSIDAQVESFAWGSWSYYKTTTAGTARTITVREAQ